MVTFMKAGGAIVVTCAVVVRLSLGFRHNFCNSQLERKNRSNSSHPMSLLACELSAVPDAARAPSPTLLPAHALKEHLPCSFRQVTWLQDQFIHPITEWWIEAVLGMWEESIKAIIRESFAKFTRGINGICSWVVAILPLNRSHHQCALSASK